MSQRATRVPAGGWRIAALALVVATTGCAEEATDDSAEAPVRGLVTTVVQMTEDTTVRRYPGVLEPGELNLLSFEVGGKLGRLDLVVGQRVGAGDLLAQLDKTQFEVAIQNRRAAVDEAQAVLEQDEDDLERAQTLLDRQAGTVVARDAARTDVRTSRAQLEQAEKDLVSAEEDLADTSMYAPFDGIINAVEVDSFATVGAGEVVLSMYEETTYEVSFSVSFDVVADIVVGTPAEVRLADDPSVVLEAVVSELGERAGTVSSFPVVVTLRETNPLIKAGMAVEVSFEFSLPAAEGFLIPISAAVLEGQLPEGAGPPGTVTPMPMFVYDPETSTVRRREVKMAGLRDNRFLIIEGLQEGERVAVAGVSFLHDGMKVRLLEPRE